MAEYLKDHNATQAAIRAGYSGKTAEVIGYENLRKPQIAEAVAAGHQRALAEAGLTAERTLEAIRQQVDGDIRDLFDDAGNLRAIKTLTRDQAALIAGFEVVKKNAEAGDGHTDTIHKVKLKDASKYVEMAAKHFSLLVEQIRLSGTLRTVIDETASDEELFAQMEAILTKARARKGSEYSSCRLSGQR